MCSHPAALLTGSLLILLASALQSFDSSLSKNTPLTLDHTTDTYASEGLNLAFHRGSGR